MVDFLGKSTFRSSKNVILRCNKSILRSSRVRLTVTDTRFDAPQLHGLQRVKMM